MRLSSSALKILAALLNDPSGSLCGSELSKLTGVGPGTIYPLLARMQKEGWVTSAWEDIDPSEEGRPKKNFYKLTGIGITRARAALAEVVNLAGGEVSWAV